jgi:hypothetical protein
VELQDVKLTRQCPPENAYRNLVRRQFEYSRDFPG